MASRIYNNAQESLPKIVDDVTVRYFSKGKELVNPLNMSMTKFILLEIESPAQYQALVIQIMFILNWFIANGRSCDIEGFSVRENGSIEVDLTVVIR